MACSVRFSLNRNKNVRCAYLATPWIWLLVVRSPDQGGNRN